MIWPSLSSGYRMDIDIDHGTCALSVNQLLDLLFYSMSLHVLLYLQETVAKRHGFHCLQALVECHIRASTVCRDTSKPLEKHVPSMPSYLRLQLKPSLKRIASEGKLCADSLNSAACVALHLGCIKVSLDLFSSLALRRLYALRYKNLQT